MNENRAKKTVAYIVVLFIISLSNIGFARNIIIGTVKRVDFNNKKVVVSVGESSKVFYFSKYMTIYYKTSENKLKLSFLKYNLLRGTKVRIIVGHSRNIKAIYVVGIPQ